MLLELIEDENEQQAESPKDVSTSWAKTWAELDRDLALELSELYGAPLTGEERDYATVDQVLRGSGDLFNSDVTQNVKAETAPTVPAFDSLCCQANVRFVIRDNNKCDERDSSHASCKSSNSLPVFDLTKNASQKKRLTRTERDDLTRCIVWILNLVQGVEVSTLKISEIEAARYALYELTWSIERKAVQSADPGPSQIRPLSDFGLFVASELLPILAQFREFLGLVTEQEEVAQ